MITKEAKLKEAVRKLSLSLMYDLPDDDDNMYDLGPEEFDEKYSKEIMIAILKR